MTTLPADYRFSTHGMGEFALARTPGQKIETYKGAYISITDRCNTDICTYCYARDQQNGLKPMPIEDFRRALSWLGTISDFPEVYLVGGEPTTVPNIEEFLDEIAARNWVATLYTNGAFNGKLRDMFAAHPGLGRVAFHYEEAFFKAYHNFRERWESNLAVLGRPKECSMIFVINGDEFEYAEPLEMARRFGLKLTWIFATPSSGHTPYVGLQTMRKAGPRVQEFLLAADAAGVTTSPDLPVPLCIFDKDFLAKHRDRFALVRRCRPFAYFKTDLSVQFCTAMPVYSAPRPADAEELAEVITRHRYADQLLKQQPSFPECIECEQHLSRLCQGGCMTYKVYAEPALER